MSISGFNKYTRAAGVSILFLSKIKCFVLLAAKICFKSISLPGIFLSYLQLKYSGCTLETKRLPRPNAISGSEFPAFPKDEIYRAVYSEKNKPSRKMTKNAQFPAREYAFGRSKVAQILRQKHSGVFFRGI